MSQGENGESIKLPESITAFEKLRSQNVHELNADMSSSEDVIKTTSIRGLLVIERPTFKDDRGFFREPLSMNEVEQATWIQFTVRQWNHSLSHPGVIRGLHADGWN